MKIKYLSDDGHEFESKSQCEKYEEAIEEIKNITKLPMKKVDGKSWFKINSLGEFYFFDHMDDRNGVKSNKSLYDISQIVFRISHYFPYWITKDFEEGIMIDKKRVEVIDKSISYLNQEIEKLKQEKKELENLRGIEITDDDYKLLVEPVEQKQEPNDVQEYEPPQSPQQPTPKQDNVTPKGIEYAKQILNKQGVQIEPVDIVQLAIDEYNVDTHEWNQMNENKRNNLIEEQINILLQ